MGCLLNLVWVNPEFFTELRKERFYHSRSKFCLRDYCDGLSCKIVDFDLI